MTLKESLDKFNQQQAKCQSTLTSLTSRAGTSKTAQSPHKAVPAATFSSIASTAPAVKFSNDTKRLQHINSIRKSPVEAQIKRVLGLLLETRQTFTPEQINEECFVDVRGNKEVFDSLRNNLKVYYDGNRFSYKPTHDVKDKSQLLVLVQEFPDGIHICDLKDAYPTVMEDLQALKAAGQVWLISNLDSREDIAYPNDPRVCVKVDDDLKLLFRGIELAQDMSEIENSLQKNGMEPATNTAKRRAAAQVIGIVPKSKGKKKPSKISKRTKLTNSHLMELFINMDFPDV